MIELLRNLLSGWVALMGAEGVDAEIGPWLAPLLVVVGAIITFAGAKVFRPVFSVVTFFGVTALLMLVLRSLLPWYAVVSIIAVIGVFATFLALFMKRVAITCLAVLGAVALAFVATGEIAFAVVGGVVALVVSLFRPKEIYIAVAALFGAALCASSLLFLIESVMPQLFGVLSNLPMMVVSSCALAIAGGAVQAFLSRKGLDPVFTQVIDLSWQRGMQAEVEPQSDDPAMRIDQEPLTASMLAQEMASAAESSNAAMANELSPSSAIGGGASGAAPDCALDEMTGLSNAAFPASAVLPAGAAVLAMGGAAGAVARACGEESSETKDSVLSDYSQSRAERHIQEAERMGVPALGAAKVALKKQKYRSATQIERAALDMAPLADAAVVGHSDHCEPLRIEKPKPYQPSYRKEIKYRIIEQDFLRLRNMMDAYLAYDSYSGAKGYAVRSLYFDSLDDRDLYDKLDGTLEHKKIRLRSYDPMGDSFNLEFKCRWNQDGFKRKLKLNREQAKRLVANDYSVLLEFDNSLARELFDRMVRGRYTPKVIVEYQRTAWLYPVSNIRVTWDQGIRASYFPESFFEERPLFIPIVPDSQGVLEIKYDYVFPSVLKDALHGLDQLPVANSKYALGRTYL